MQLNFLVWKEVVEKIEGGPNFSGRRVARTVAINKTSWEIYGSPSVLHLLLLSFLGGNHLLLRFGFRFETLLCRFLIWWKRSNYEKLRKVGQTFHFCKNRWIGPRWRGREISPKLSLVNHEWKRILGGEKEILRHEVWTFNHTMIKYRRLESILDTVEVRKLSLMD